MKSFLYIANIRLPTEKAHGIQIMKTCESLAMQGLRVVLLIPNRKNNIKIDPFSFYGAMNNFIIARKRCVDFIDFPIFKKFFFWLETFSFHLSAKKYIKAGQFEIYYTRDLFFALMLSKKHKKVFYEVHSLPKKVKNKHKKTWNRVAGLVAISNNIKKELVSFGVDEKKIIIARDAVEIDKFKVGETKNESRKKLNLPLKEKIALYTGHLYEWKGADIFAESARFLPDVKFYIVGGTEEDVKKFRKKFNNQNLQIVGWKPHKDIPLWLNAADVLVLPNSAKERISSHYTSPMKMFEYMASGIPIVASKLSSVGEVLNKGNCWLVEPDMPKDLAKKIYKSLVDKKTSSKLAKQAIADVADYSWEGRSEKIIRSVIV